MEGFPANVRVDATNSTGTAATLYGFIDWNDDGDFGDSNETTTIVVPDGSTAVLCPSGTSITMSDDVWAEAVTA